MAEHIPVPAEADRPAHALLSASGSKIWLACTPSARFGEHEPDQSSRASEEGTFAHGLAHAKLLVRLKRDREALNKYHAEHQASGDWKKFYNAEMEEEVQAYVNRCMADVEETLAADPQAVIFVEQLLDFSEWVPAGFGTGDMVIVSRGRVHVRDLKYGKGVHVEVQDNSQGMLYAGGAYLMFSSLFEFDTIDITIDQGRKDNIATWTIPVADLLTWLEETVRPRAALAWAGEGEFVPGEHCGFCRARHKCRARAEAHLIIAGKCDPDADFADLGPSMSQEEIAELLPKLDDFVKWASGLKNWALTQQVLGKAKWDGLKLVAGRSTRKIIDPEGLATELILTHGANEEELYTKKLLGLGALEALVGKKAFSELSQPFVAKPPGKPKLVPIDDKRPEWVPPENVAELDFGDLEDE